MKDESLLRYSRQIMLPEIGIDGQERLLNSRVLIMGLGGLGCPVAIYLAASGVAILPAHKAVFLFFYFLINLIISETFLV